MSLAPSCPRCGGEVRPPNLMRAEWSCDQCGPIAPLHRTSHVDADIIAGVVARIVRRANAASTVPLWCPWPSLPGWAVTGVAWAGDDRTGVKAAALALSGPAPLTEGPADLVLVAEQLGVGLGAGLAGLAGPDPGPEWRDAVLSTGAHAKVRVDNHSTPLWFAGPRPQLRARTEQAAPEHAKEQGTADQRTAERTAAAGAGETGTAETAAPGTVAATLDRSVYVGEARAIWLYAITWPASAGYLLAEQISLHDLVDSIPAELIFGAPTSRLLPITRKR